MLVIEIVQIAVAWLLNRNVRSMQHIRFTDGLFLLGVLELMAASIGMMGRPYNASQGPGRGVPAYPVQPSDQEERSQALAELVEGHYFASRLAIIGVVTILIAVGLTYL